MTELEKKALQFAKKAHTGQFRKYTGEPYIVHPVEVANLVRDYAHTCHESMYCAALLHDTVEDTNTTIEDIRREFGDIITVFVEGLTDVSKPEAGNRESTITGMCEACFDSITFSMEENLNRLDERVLGWVTSTEGLVLAGGSLRKLVDNSDVLLDYDLFLVGDNKEAVKKDVVNHLKVIGEKVFECPEGKLYSYVLKGTKIKIQLIDKRTYSDVWDLLSSFDITACCAVWDGDNIFRNNRFVFDVLNKRINLNTVEYPVATIKRIEKYIQKGYSLSNSSAKFFVDTVSINEWSDDDLALYID